MQKYVQIRSRIEKEAPSFKSYIDNILYGTRMSKLINFFLEQTEVYVFSGVIRNYLLGYGDAGNNRDYDFVVANLKKIEIPEYFIKDLHYKRNKFGGYKILENGSEFDIWGLEDTWGIVKKKETNPDATALIQSAFFNFSAIAFDYNKSQFVFGDDFCRFYQSQKMDIVFSPNPFRESCIVNSLYYSQKYKFEIGPGLKKWIIKNHSSKANYIPAQIKRYGQVIYDRTQIENFVNSLED